MPITTTQHPDAAQAERLGDEIAELSAHIEVATARLLDLIQEFDTLGGWSHAGAKSCAEWLSWRVGLDLNAAGERIRVARALPALPRIRQAFEQGRLSYSKVRALTRVATADAEERLLTAGISMTAAQLERLVRACGGSIATPKIRTRRGATTAARSTCIKTRTACSWSVGA